MAEPEPLHWSYGVLKKLQKDFGDKGSYTVASGITPSGTVHIGNFREVITVDIVARALRLQGKEVRFIYSWDDYDVFRKVPINMPDQEVLKAHLRMAITDTPDTTGQYSSFALRNEKMFEEHLPKVGIFPEFIRQSEQYRKCAYAQEIDHCLRHTSEIREILDQYRKEPLALDWLPVAIFCESCGKDTIEKIEYHGDYKVYYKCSCGKEEEFDIRKKGIIKLKWRVDWPMRWHHEGVEFEPAGKDHFAAGGSRESGVKIQQKLWGDTPPFGFMYEWIGLKGGAHFHSSSGNVLTLPDLLEVYEPAILRWLFAGTRPNAEFSISFDADVLKLYEDFDRCERIYFGKEQVNEKEAQKQKEIYLLSVIDTGKVPKDLPYQPPFRHLTMILQIHGMDIVKAGSFFEKDIKNESDRSRLLLRAHCAKNWIEKHAPEEFRFSVQDTVPAGLDIPQEVKAALKKIPALLKSQRWETPEELHEAFFSLIKENGVDSKAFFRGAYLALIGKEKGPKLASFIHGIGTGKVAELFMGIE